MARLGGNCICKQKIADSVTRYTKVDPALQQELQKIVESLSVPGKGILAIDESSADLESKFRAINPENTETAQRNSGQMLSDKTQLSEYISGVVLNHETLYQKTTDNKEFVNFLRERNLIPGVKVDRGTIGLFGTANEDTSEGLDGLQERCMRYKMDGCHFTKWRCTYKLSDNRPSELAIKENARVLARYASIVQSARMVPIVEPEVLTTGEHEMPRALQVHEEVLSVLFRTLMEYHVFLEGMILETAMVVAGVQNAKFCKPHIVADFTLTALRRTVPSAVPTIMFLIGGQSDEDPIVNLNAINNAEGKKPWTLSFCFEHPTNSTTPTRSRENPENIDEARSIFLRRVKQCCEASRGRLNVEEFVKCERPSIDDSDVEE